MAEHPASPPSTPDSSVVNEEALRALRAVQRMLVPGSEAGQGALVGGVAAAQEGRAVSGPAVEAGTQLPGASAAPGVPRPLSGEVPEPARPPPQAPADLAPGAVPAAPRAAPLAPNQALDGGAPVAAPSWPGPPAPPSALPPPTLEAPQIGTPVKRPGPAAASPAAPGAEDAASPDPASPPGIPPAPDAAPARSAPPVRLAEAALPPRPPHAESPVVVPSLAEPPAAEPPAAEPPAAEPPAAEPPAAEPPVAEPPAAEPPVAEPPVAEPPVAKPPVAEPVLPPPPQPDPTLLLHAADAFVLEDSAVALDLSAALMGMDGSETLLLRLEGMPEGAALSAGARQADGAWALAPEDLPGLRLTPPADFAGTLRLALRGTAREEGGEAASNLASFTVTVAPVADPVLLGAEGSGEEDGWIPLRGSLALSDGDGSERFGGTLTVRGLPAGALLSQGRETAPGIWEVPLEAFRSGALAVLPPADSDADMRLVLSVTSTDSAAGLEDSRITEAEVSVVVRASADAPLVTVADFQGQEDMPLRLSGLGGALRDMDGSESLGYVLSGVPAGARLSAGTKLADGSWALTPAQLAELTLTPPAQFSGRIPLTLTAIATEAADGGPAASSSAGFTVSLDPVADPGTIGGQASGKEDRAITLRPAFATPDADGSESWSAFSEIGGVPAGAVLSQGTEVAPGLWRVSTAALRDGRVTLTPPPDSDADFQLTIAASLTDTGNGLAVSRDIAGSYTVKVAAVADAPLASGAGAAGEEDRPIALSLFAALRDTDGSEKLGLVILGVPAGATLSRGSRAADGSWTVTAADLEHLSLTPPRDFSGEIGLTLRATAADRDNSVAVTSVPFTVRVAAVADAPGLRTGPVAGDEDSAIALRMAGWTTDADGSESLIAFRLAGVPEGAVVRAAGVVLAREADGSILVAPEAMGGLTVTPPPHSGRDFTLRISAISAEPNGSRAEAVPLDLPVRVRAVADAPVVTGTGGEGAEDNPVPLDLSAHLADQDGSERLFLLVSGLPDGARLSAGAYRGGGAWSLTAEEARHVSLLPPRDFAGTIGITLTAVAQEADGGSTARAAALLPVRIGAVVDAPAVGGLDGHSGDWGRMAGTEDTPIALRLDPGLRDRDGSERVVGAIVLGGVPEGAVLRLADGSAVAPGADGLHRIDAARMEGVTLTMPPDSDAAANLTLRMTVEDTGGVRQEIGGRMVVDPAGVADAPVLALRDVQAPAHAGGGAAAGWVGLPVSAALADLDGSETLAVWVRGVPQGFMLSAGTPDGEGAWLVPAAALEGLSLRPPAGFTGGIALRVQAVSEEAEGGRAISGGLLHVTITPAPGATPEPGPEPEPEPEPQPGPGPGSAPGAGPETGPGGGSPPPGAPPLLVAEAEPAREDGSAALRIALASAAPEGRGDVLGLRVEGLPEGARLSAGARDPETGAWVLRPEELAELRVLPPADFSGTLHLVLRGVAVEPGGTSLTTTRALDIAVEAVADAALVTAAPAPAREDGLVALNLRAAPGDTDGSESVVAVLISGLPAGASIAAGPGIADNGDGTWSVAPEHLADVRLLPPPDASGTFRLTVTAITREAGNGDTRGQSAEVAFTVSPAPDAPLVAATDARGLEDRAVPLALSALLADRDGSEILSVVLEGLPHGTRLSAGVNNGDGSWTLTSAQLAGLTLTPPGNWSGRMALTLVAHAMEGEDAAAASSRASFHVEVAGVADAPMVDAASHAAGGEDAVLPLDIRALLADGDGSETLSVHVAGVPAGARFTMGTDHGDGSWTIPGGALPSLGFQPPPDYSGTLRLRFTVVAAEADGDSSSHPPFDMTLAIHPVADAPVLDLAGASGAEDMPVALPIAAALSDTDGSEQLARIIVSGVPAGARLSAGSRAADGGWVLRPDQLAGLTLAPPPNFSGPLTLSVTAVSVEGATGMEAGSTGSMSVHVAPVADAPLLAAQDATGLEDQPVALPLGVTLADLDGSERLSGVTLHGLPEGAALSAGQPDGGGAWHVAAADLGTLRLLPPPDWSGTMRLTLRAVSEEGASGATAAASRDFTVTLGAVNDAPTLILTPAAQPGVAGAAEVAVLEGASAADTDSPQLGGAAITLGGAREGDALAFEGYAPREAEGRILLGDTGIELVQGGYDGATGQLLLRGPASAGTYSAVLRSLVLENNGAEGLAAGARSVSVVLRDEQGAEAARQTVSLTLEQPVPPAPPPGMAEASGGAQDAAGPDALTLAVETAGDAAGDAAADWASPPAGAEPAQGSDWTRMEEAAATEPVEADAGAGMPQDDGMLGIALPERPHWP